ncbi:MAG: hypothetical protein ACI9LV_000950 [Candidatus Nanohaloarchaea archaeon]|jgi:hypothetical protein
MSDLSEEIQEIKEELQQVKERNKELEQKIEEQNSGKDSSDSAGKSENISRRKFLKMAGLGAGAIGLTSATSAWSILQPSGQGTSDIDATNLQGNTPSDFATQTDINNHAGDNSAHHTKPTSTQSYGSAVEDRFSILMDDTGTFLLSEYVQKIESFTSNDSDEVKVYWTDGGSQTYRNADIPATFNPPRHVREVEISNNASGSGGFNLVLQATEPHSHNI